MELPDAPWTRPADEVAEALDVRIDRGLSDDEAGKRLERHGPNRLEEHERAGLGEVLWHQVKSLIILLLAVAAGVALIFGEQVEAIAIGAVIVLNTAIGFFTELRAVRSMEALRTMGQAEAQVRRDGSSRTVAARELVPGDVVLLEKGSVLAADLRLVEVEGLQIDESALTGESAAVDKGTEAVAEDVPLGDRICMAYRGTAVRRGRGTGVVVRTGMETEMGEISSMVERAEKGRAPLDERLDRLGQKLVWLTLAVAAVVSVAGILAGRELYLMIETGIALAIAAVPEGLAIVATVALARGMRRMMGRNALVRRLTAVETLGSTTIICADKTGTLTENEMTVRRLVGPTGEFRFSGEAPEELHPLLLGAVLANEAERPAENGEPEGDAMDLALLRLGEEVGMAPAGLLEEHPRTRIVSFDRETKMMASIHEGAEGYRVFVKGSPDAVLEASDTSVGEEAHDRDGWIRRSDEMAADGLRVLAVADGSLDDPEGDPYDGLRFLGLVGFLDPPRSDVAPAIERCQDAGILVVMVTGDHPETARHIALEVGLDVEAGDGLVVVNRGEMPEEASEEDRERLAAAQVVARMNPKQKLELVELHQGRGEVLGMTGDGVNDAPALRAADIGIAMGRRGTEVAREAGDMVLLDDAFSTIVAAVEQGRSIFRNIRKFVIYLLSGNVGEILAVGAAAVAALPLPLLPLQILYLNMVNDVFPALALGVGPGDPRLMDRPPRDPEEGIVEGRHWRLIGGYGLMIGVVVLGVFLLALNHFDLGQEEAVTVSFLGLSLARLLHVFNMRDADAGILKNPITANPVMWGALALCLGFLALAVFFGPLAGVLEVVVPGPTGWLLVAATGVAVLLLGQLYLLAADARRGTEEG